MGQTGRVPSWNAFSYVFGPITAFGGLALLVVVLRWSTSSGGSLVQRPVRPGDASEYGLLVPIAEPRTQAEGEAIQRRLEERGLRATLARTNEGHRVLVFPADAEQARSLLG